MLKNFISQKDGSVSLEDYETALDEILRLRERIAELEAAQQSGQADGSICSCSHEDFYIVASTGLCENCGLPRR